MPLRRTSGHTFQSPSTRIRSFDIQHTDNPSLHEAAGNGTATSNYGAPPPRPEALLGEQKVVASLVTRLVNKLPCNSGIKLAMMEIDEGVKTTVESLLQIARIRLGHVVHALASALETLSKYSTIPALVDWPLDIIHSQLYLLHLLVLCLSESWKLNASKAKPPLSELPGCWPDPPPLDDHLARQLLSVIMLYINKLSQDGVMGASGAATPVPNRDGKSPSTTSVASWGQQATLPGATSFSLGANFIQQHSYPSASTPPPNAIPEHAKLLAPTASSNSLAIKQLTKRAARTIFYISASNWPLVLSRIKARVGSLTTTLEENPELYELRFLEWANVDSTRLGQALQEISSPFLHVKRPGQTALASALRNAIWHWIDVYPNEYQALLEGKLRIEGGPEVLFDVLLSISDSAASSKRVKVFYPLMTMLLVLSPEPLKRIAMGEVSRGSSGLAKKLSFMENLRKGLTVSKAFEASAVCYVDLLRAAMACSPRLESSGIRTLAPDLQNDLKNALFYSPLASEITDLNILVDGLVALYRFNPTGTAAKILPKLWTDNSDNSKIIGARACSTLVMEGQRLPWHQPPSGLRPEVSLAIRSILRAQAPAVINGTASRRGRNSLDLPSAPTDVTWEILHLLSLDPLFAFEGIGETTDTLGQLFVVISSLTAASCPMTIRAQASKANLVILDCLVEAAKTDASKAALAVNSAVSVWQILIDSSRQLLIDFQLGDVDDMAMMCGAFRATIHAVLRATIALPEIAKAPNARPAVLVAKVATVTSLTGADVEQTNTAAPALLALAKLMTLVRSAISNSQSQMDEITSHSAMLTELGSLPTATGRNQQQRAVRRIMKAHVRSSTLLSTVWLGLAARAKTLTAKILSSDSDGSSGERDFRRRNMAADIDGLSEDESKEWQNLIFFLCATSNVAGSGNDSSVPQSISEVVGRGVLPRVYDEAGDVTTAVDAFLRQCVDFLISSSIHVRESVKDALGSELPLSLCRVLVVQMTQFLSHSVGPAGVSASDAFTTFVEAAISVLRLWVDRVNPAENANGVQVDVGELLYLIGQYTHRLGRDEPYMRIKIKFCQLIDAVLAKPEFVVLGNASKLRNALLEWMCEWSVDSFRDEFHNTGIQDKIQRDLDLSCLRAMIPVTDGLVIRSASDETEDSQNVAKSRLFYRYYHMLVRVLERANSFESESSHMARSVSGMSTRVTSSESYPALAILVLSNLLSANVDVGLKHCLALGYHDDSSIRTAFMQLTTNVLQQGARFGGLAAKSGSSAPKAYLEAAAAPNLALAMAMCEVCPSSEIDEISLILFRVFEARGNLLALMKLLIEREVALTSHESELFRANSITTRLLTHFAKTYGYNYVRATLQPLIVSLSEKPAECSFELDPTKATATDDIDRNAEHLRLMCQALLDIIYSSTPRVPILFRALCHHIWETVEERFPDSKHSAVGSFVFLRFFCPAIVAPEGMDLDVAPDNKDTRRALLLITKVIQNLANNVLFGNKEAHMKVLNAFLSENIRQVTKFLADIAVRPRSWEVAQATKFFQEEGERMLDADTENLVIQRFVFKHRSRLEATLENLPPSYRVRAASSSRAMRLDLDGKGTLVTLRRLMGETGPPTDAVRLSSSARSQVYDDFMRHNSGRNTESVSTAFYEGPANQNGRRMFYFIVSQAALMDYDLLAYQVFSTLDKVTDFFDLVIDLTDFSPSTEIPTAWLRRSIQMCPPGILPLVNTLGIYNVNPYAKRRIRRVLSDLAPVCPQVGKTIVGATSPGELAEWIQYSTLQLPERTMNLAFESEHVYTNLLAIFDHEMQIPVVVKLGRETLQVATWRKQEIYNNVKTYVVEIIGLKDVDDVVVGTGPTQDHLTIKYLQNQTVTLVSRITQELAHKIRGARGRLRDIPSEDRALRPSDVPGTLLNVALLNMSSGDETLRLGAYSLVYELCQFFKYDLSSQVTKVNSGLVIPSNSLAFAAKISRALATSAPNLTLEFLKEWTIGFTKADTPQKTACLHYVGPWLNNLELFAKPTRDDGVESVRQVTEIIRSLIALTVAEKRRLHLALQDEIWSVLGASHESVVDLVVTELLNSAVNAGPGSEKAECAANILVSLSTTAVKGKVVARLRKTIAQTYLRPSSDLTENAAWNEICTLARINLSLSFSPLNPMDTQLFLPELFHIVVMIVGIGPVLMRQTVYGLVVNTLQSLTTAAATGDMDPTTLQHLLHRVQQADMISAFGLLKLSGSLELSGQPMWDAHGINRLDSLEMVTKFLGDVLAAGAISTDCANAWRARWMGLVAATCFQHNPATQPQAFTALGYLASDEVDDDLVYQVLVALSTSLTHLQESDTMLIVSMLRCLARVIPGLVPDSRYAPTLFWLAVAVLQLAHIPLFGPALELLLTTMRHMHQSGAFANGFFDSLLTARRTVSDSARKLDQICGVNFDTDPCFALVAIIYKGIRHPNTRQLTISTLTEFLQLSVLTRNDVSEEDSPLIGSRSVAFFTALLPISSANPSSLKALFAAAGIDVAEAELQDLSKLSVFELLAIPDNSTALLLVTLIVTILGNASTDNEKLVLYRLLAEASQDMPEVVAMAYDTLIPRMTSVLTTTTSTAILQSVTQIFERAMADVSYTFPTGLGDSSYKKSSAVAARDQVLDDLGMKGLSDMSFQGVKIERLSSMAKWVANLIESLTM